MDKKYLAKQYKVLLSLSVILAFFYYSLHQRFQDSNEISGVVIPNNITNTPDPSSAPVTQQINGQYKDGEYVGDVTDAYYGNVQVQAMISGGKITNVLFLQYPNDRRTSIEINTQAMPYLKQEAIKAQNANVDIVSGATQTSRAFRQSLQSALDKAKA